MLETLFKRDETLARLRAGAVGAHLDGFLEHLAQTGFAARTMRQYLGGPLHFGLWARRARVDLARLREEDVVRFQLHLQRCRCQPRYHARACCRSDVALAGLRCFIRYLRHIGVVSPVPVVALPAIVMEFEAWMRGQRGSAERTLTDYRQHVLRFVEATGNGDPGRLEARTVREYVITRAEKTTRTQMLVVIRALRMFVRFLVTTRRCPSHLDRAVPSVPHWRLATLPRYLTPTQVERVIARCRPSTPLGRRDRAVVLLLARLGLRAADVRTMRLSDIDWRSGRIRVTGKTRRATWLPLPQEVGDAVLAYLARGRPACAIPEVFVCATAPHRALGATTVSHIASRALVRAGIPDVRGAHVFRHSVATALLQRGAKLDDIGVLLRHASRDSTAIYAKVDLAALRRIAQPWPKALP